jgi:hypothetical protein
VKHPIIMCTTLALCFCTVLPISVSSQMQEQGAPAGPGAQKAQKLAQVLNLSPQQRSQLTPILEAEAPKLKAITQDPNLTPSEKKKRLKAVHSQTDPLVKSILNPTQYKQWEVIRKDELEQMQ